VLPIPSNVSSASDWCTPVSNLTFHEDGYCCYQQIKLGIFQGYYSQDNISLASGNVRRLVNPSSSPACIGINQNVYHRLPSSAIIDATLGKSYFPMLLRGNVTVAGYYPPNASSSTSPMTSIYTTTPFILAFICKCL
jgi:hypothetical protein